MRDECEHGSLRRSCTVCDLLDDVRDLEQERDEMKARCERLRRAAEMAIDNAGKDLPEVWGEINKILAETPAVSLAHVRAETIEQAEYHAITEMSFGVTGWHHGYVSACNSIKDFATSIRQSATQSGASND